MTEPRNLIEKHAVSPHGPAAVSSSDNCESGDTVETSSSSDPETKVPEVGEALLQRLARQMEYYFSTSNLAKDTYVCTLRSLNDGYVPITIIANFGKVKSLVPYDTINTVRKAVVHCSSLLEVVQIDSQTGKRVSVDEKSGESPLSAVEAVGPINGEPIPLSQIPTTPVTQPTLLRSTSAIQNTVIIREVPLGTEESHVRDLFTFEKCPAIQSLHLDVANCWFVTLDTESRDAMVNVMLELRKMKFTSGEPVKARLKFGAVMNSDAPAFVPGQQMVYAPQSPSPNRYLNSNGSRKNKKKKNNLKPRTNVTSNQNKNGKGNTNTNSRSRRSNGGKQKRTNGQDQSKQNTSKDKGRSQQLPAPALGEDHFPALPSEDTLANSTKIELEKVPEQRPEDDFELEKNRAHSDSASTATTTSSSSSSKQTPQQQAIGGYAAALLRAAPPKLQIESENRSTKSEKKNEKKNNGKKKESEPSQPKQTGLNLPEEVESSPLLVQPPSWGGGRSFADILRKEAAAAVAAPQQSA